VVTFGASGRDQGDYKRVPTCYVIHNPKRLLDGITVIEIYHNNASQTMERQGLTCETITYTTDSGAEHQADVWPFLAESIHPSYDWPAFDAYIATLKNDRDILVLEPQPATA